MGFNLGAFAGGVAQGGLNAYKTISDVQSQNKRDALVELQTKEAEQAMKGREALRSAIAEQGDMNTVNPAQMMAGPAPQGLPQEGGYMTPEVAASEKLARVRQRALEGGADPTAVMQYANAQRADTSAFNEDKAFEWMRGIDKTVATKGLAKAAEEHLFPEYNKNQGLMNDGLTAHLGKNNLFVDFKDKDGKVVRSEPLNMQTFNMARDQVGQSMLAASGASNFYKTKELGLKQSELGLKGKELDAKIPLYKAQAGLAAAHTGVYNNMLETAKTNKAAGEAMKPYLDEFAALSEEDQVGQKGQAVLLKGATAGASKSKDLAGVVSMLRKPDRAAVSAEQEKKAYDALNVAIEAGDQKKIDFVKAQYPNVFGEDPMVKQVREAIEAKKKAESGSTGKTDTDNKPATALPASAPVMPKPQTSALAGVAAPYQQRLGELAPLIEVAQNKIRSGGGLNAARELQTLTQERDKILANPVMK